jgi:hypothetical protein
LGGWDNHAPLDWGAREKPGFKKKIQKLIADLDWSIDPVFCENLGPHAWYREKIHNPMLVSLSTHFMEDFSVSAAQAQAQGWPCLVPSWGGFQDICGPNVLKFSPHLVASEKWGDILSSSPQKDRRARRAVRAPDVTSASALTQIRKFIADKYRCRPPVFATRSSLATWARTGPGKKFFADYRQEFSGFRIRDKK